MKASCTELTPARKRLARIRCLDGCIKSFRDNKKLPEPLCYIPREREYKLTKAASLALYPNPDKTNKDIASLSKLILMPSPAKQKAGESNNERNNLHIVVTSGEELCNSQGQWARFLRHVKPQGAVEDHGCEGESWVHLFSSQGTSEDGHILQLLVEDKSLTTTDLLLGAKPRTSNNWEEVVENTYAIYLGDDPVIAPVEYDAMEKLSSLPANWSIDHDEDLAQFLSSNLESDNEHLGSIKNYVEDIKVSSSSEEDEGPENLTDGDTETYWESDGNQGEHWIRMFMKKGTIVKHLSATIDGNDDNYMPYRFIVKGGENGSLKQLSDIRVDQSIFAPADVLVLEDQTEHYPIIEIWIKECKDDGIDTRIHGIKLKSTKERDMGLNKDLFSAEHLVRFPKLESFDAEILYRRAIALQRFVTLLDSVLPYIAPTWEYSIGSVPSLDVVRQLLPLSKKRMSLIEKFLRESENGQRLSVKRLYINRRAAADHRSDPTQDLDCKFTVFNQVFEGLKPRERSERPLDYRWSCRHDQWWECKFIGEGIIDQGGGFRDSLSDISEELCPSDFDVAVPLPYFIRSPNQNCVDSNINKDVYIPNPSSEDFSKYDWIGKLMGACFRGKENLVLSLPSFVWKKLSVERVTWLRDYITVDEAEVRMIESMADMTEEEFEVYFSSEHRTFSTSLSDGTVVNLKPDGVDMSVTHTERTEYCQLVKEKRMSEFDEQITAMRKGFLQVIPQAVVDLLTWQELEKRICGNPEISLEALKRSSHYEDLEEDDTQVKYLWEALGAFSNADRSRFLRFVTGRRRLPAPIYICLGKGKDSLPESSTCSNTLYLPNYSSAKVAEDKIRYASYNCIAIDTDMSPWDT